MSFTIGAQIMCDRCGAAVFTKFTGNGNEWARSSDRSNYDKAANWLKVTISGLPEMEDLCPSCARDYHRLASEFKRPPARLAKEAERCDT